MSDNHIVYIIGFMGSGKSTAGRNLAESLGWSFIDLDHKIEEHTGMKIPEIFSRYGEDHFREIESLMLRSIAPDSNTVVATGGGAPCYNDNMKFMLKTGLTIYLELTPAQLADRLRGSSDERPLIKNMQGEELLHYIENKLSERSEWYQKSHIIQNGFDPDIHDLHYLVKLNLDLQ
ncbi:MAG: AAA family ATPase [Bacteroidetes bacterium]|nr:AAA family ATPase [Bacteroidota bacterium]